MYSLQTRIETAIGIDGQSVKLYTSKLEPVTVQSLYLFQDDIAGSCRSPNLSISEANKHFWRLAQTVYLS